MTSSLEIDDIKCLNIADGDASVQIVNADGSWGTMGVWLNEYGSDPAGWFTDILGTTPAEITLEPGQSVFFYTTATTGKVVIPSAL